MTGLEELSVIVKALDDKKGFNLQVLKIGDLSIVADYFVLATGNSSTHVRSLAEEVEDAMTKAGKEPLHIEGRSTGWVVIDYGTTVVHVFQPEAREYYNLERLWADAEPIDIQQFIENREG